MTAPVAKLNHGYGTLRCIAPQDFCECGESRLHAERHERSGCKLGFVGCGWSGPSAWVKTFGMTVSPFSQKISNILTTDLPRIPLLFPYTRSEVPRNKGSEKH
mgnify:CR=1 FL=1